MCCNELERSRNYEENKAEAIVISRAPENGKLVLGSKKWKEKG